mgnify:CR=1 FL=1
MQARDPSYLPRGAAHGRPPRTGALEPILLIRGSAGGTERPPEAATWQRAYAPHWLVSDE